MVSFTIGKLYNWEGNIVILYEIIKDTTEQYPCVIQFLFTNENNFHKITVGVFKKVKPYELKELTEEQLEHYHILNNMQNDISEQKNTSFTTFE